MHPALQIDEILMNIFYGSPSSKIWRGDFFTPVDLAALARTCRTFKEPALDTLWSELDDLDPLLRCLPEFIIQIPRDFKDWYKVHRPFKQGEWNVIRSYARRIRSVKNFEGAFHLDCIETLLNPPTPDPLFPNLRYVSCAFTNKVTPFLRQPLPSLISLNYSFNLTTNTSVYRDSLSTILNVAQISLRIAQPRSTLNDPIFFKFDPEIDRVVSAAICRWLDLRTVSCGHFALTLDAIKHLSRAENLTRLAFTLEVTLPDQIASFDTSICFKRLRELEVLCSGPSTAISKLLSHLRLPVMEDLTVKFDGCPSKRDVASFLDVLKSSGICGTIRKFGFVHDCHSYRSLSNYILESSTDVLDCYDLRPIMAFRNLRVLDFNVRWNLGLTGEDLVELASAWPYLEEISINRHWGWNKGFRDCAITPEDIIRLLRTRPSLKKLALAIDIRSAALHHRPPPIDLADLPKIVEIDVLDTGTIDEATISAMVSLLTYLIPTGRPLLSLYKSHDYWPTEKEQARRWDDLSEQLQLAYNTSH